MRIKTGKTAQGYEIKRIKPGNYEVSHPDKTGIVHVIGNCHAVDVYEHEPGEPGTRFDYRHEWFSAFDYRGQTYDLSDMSLNQSMWTNSPDWVDAFGDASMSDSFFSGMIIGNYQPDGWVDYSDDQIIVWTYY